MLCKQIFVNTSGELTAKEEKKFNRNIRRKKNDYIREEKEREKKIKPTSKPFTQTLDYKHIALKVKRETTEIKSKES